MLEELLIEQTSDNCWTILTSNNDLFYVCRTDDYFDFQWGDEQETILAKNLEQALNIYFQEPHSEQFHLVEFRHCGVWLDILAMPYYDILPNQPGSPCPHCQKEGKPQKIEKSISSPWDLRCALIRKFASISLSSPASLLPTEERLAI